MLKKNDVLERVKELDFPKDAYLVFSGAVMAVHGIRETEDVDIVVSGAFFESLKQMDGWRVEFSYETAFCKRGDVEVASRLDWEEYATTFEEAKRRQDIISGVPFMSLDDVVQFKRAMGRKKDHEDINLIKTYKESKN